MGKCTSIPADPTENRNMKNEVPKWFPASSSTFTIKKKLGGGASGVVYSVLHKETNTMYALKRIRIDNKCSSIQFTTEARVLSRIKHPSIIKYINMFRDNKYYYLLLEKADYDLWGMMNPKKCLSEEQTKRIIYQLLESVVHIHKKNLVHRDIKPENIVFKDNVPKLIDFGDAEMATPNKIYTELVGTPQYMSPERLQEHNAMELKKSDVWALAVVAYEMYSGKRCFDGNNQKHVFGQILCGDWKWNIDRIPSDEMKDFVEKCLCLDVEKRLSSAEALSHAWFNSIKHNIG
eukprot:156836_1